MSVPIPAPGCRICKRAMVVFPEHPGIYGCPRCDLVPLSINPMRGHRVTRPEGAPE